MKKRITFLFAAILFLFCMSAYGQTFTIDDAIVGNMKYLSGKLSTGSKVVIINIESENKNLSDYIISECDAFVMNNTKLSLVDKSKLTNILQRKNIDELNEINEATALEIGKELGASNIILGSVSKLGSNFRFRIQALGTADGKINGMQSLNVKEDDILLDLIATSGSPATKKRDAEFDDLSNLRSKGGLSGSQSAQAKLETETNDRNNSNQNRTIFAQPTIWNSTADVSWYNNVDSVFLISTAEQLAGLAVLVNDRNNFLGKTIKLTQDIFLNDTTGWKNWDKKNPPKNEWEQIGFFINGGLWFRIRPFMGKFEGDGHFIYGMYINYRRYPIWVVCAKGLFGWTQNATISNVCLSNFYVYSNNNLVGAIAGINTNSIIEKCAISGVIKGRTSVGGVSGINALAKNVSNNTVYAEITGKKFVGGISGFINYSDVCENTFNGNVSGRRRSVGVLVGKAHGESRVANNEFLNKNNAKVVGKSKRKVIVENNTGI